jgi:DNA-binding beta-propeller fold protein YncE
LLHSTNSSIAAVCAAAALLACGAEPAATGAPPADSAASAAAPSTAPAAPLRPRSLPREGASVARAGEASDWLAIADEDHSLLWTVALPLADEPRAVSTSLPGRPAQVVVAGGRALVTVRDLPEGGGALLALERDPSGSARETGRVALPSDAWGLALSPDASFAVVTSAWTATISVVDLRTMSVRARVPVAREPRGVTVTPDGKRAYVSHLVGAAVTRIDDLDSTAPRARSIDLPAAPLRAPAGKALTASLGYAALVHPDGDRLWFPRHALGALGGEAWYGSAAVDVLLTADDSALAPRRGAGMPQVRAPFVAAVAKHAPWQEGIHTTTATGTTAFVQPRAAIYRESTDTLLVASEGGDALVELDAGMADPTLGVLRTHRLARRTNAHVGVAGEGGAPSGIALSDDENTAFVFCRSTDDLLAVTLPRGEGTYTSVPPTRIALAPADADESVALGRRLFFNATDTSTSGGLACAGCHPDGRDDGFVWRETRFTSFTNFVASAEQAAALIERWPSTAPEGEGTVSGYPRQTPMLAGRVRAQGPYGWHAENADLPARIIAGFALHRWKEQEGDGLTIRGRALHLTNYLRKGLVPPPRPAPAATEAELRGKALFESEAVGCAGCHLPKEDLTNRTAVPMRRLPTRAGFSEEARAEWKTPSLFFVGGTAPYFHDGRFESLESLVELNGDAMGKTAHLSADDKKALVAYLRTL